MTNETTRIEELSADEESLEEARQELADAEAARRAPTKSKGREGETMRKKADVEFIDWIREVDRKLFTLSGITSEDQPEARLSDWYCEGLSTNEAAARLMDGLAPDEKLGESEGSPPPEHYRTDGPTPGERGSVWLDDGIQFTRLSVVAVLRFSEIDLQTRGGAVGSAERLGFLAAIKRWKAKGILPIGVMMTDAEASGKKKPKREKEARDARNALGSRPCPHCKEESNLTLSEVRGGHLWIRCSHCDETFQTPRWSRDALQPEPPRFYLERRSEVKPYPVGGKKDFMRRIFFRVALGSPPPSDPMPPFGGREWSDLDQALEEIESQGARIRFAGADFSWSDKDTNGAPSKLFETFSDLADHARSEEERLRAKWFDEARANREPPERGADRRFACPMCAEEHHIDDPMVERSTCETTDDGDVTFIHCRMCGAQFVAEAPPSSKSISDEKTRELLGLGVAAVFPDLEAIPPRWRWAMGLYLVHGVEPDVDILRAILRGHLFHLIDACGAKDWEDAERVARYLRNNAPAHCFGDDRRVAHWMKSRRAEIEKGEGGADSLST